MTTTACCSGVVFLVSTAAFAGPAAVIQPGDGTVVIRNDTREVNLRNGGARNITIKRFIDDVTIGGADNTAVTTEAVSGTTTINVSDGTSLVGEIGGLNATAKQDGDIIVRARTGTRIVGSGENGVTARSDGGRIHIEALGGPTGLVSGVNNGIVAEETGTGRVEISATSGVIGDRDRDGNGTGIAVTANGGTVNIVSNSVVGSQGIVVRNQDTGADDGDVTIIANGPTRGRLGDGIRTVVTGDGSNSVTANGDVSAGVDGDGIETRAASGLTTVTVNAGVAVRAGQTGILTQSGSGTTVISVADDALVKGEGTGISAHSDSGSLLIRGAGNIVGTAGDAINADIDGGTGDIDIRTAGIVRGGRNGIIARNDGTGAVSITTTGAVKGDNIGIAAISTSGPLTVSGRGNVTGSNGDGIAATILSGDSSLEVTPTGDIRGGRNAILAQQLGSGDVLVRTDGTITGGFGGVGNGIQVRANGGAATVITRGDVTGDEGIVVANRATGGADGNVVIRTEAAVRGRTGDAIRSAATGLGDNTVVVGGDVTSGSAGNAVVTRTAAGATLINVKAGTNIKGGQSGVVATSRSGDIDINSGGDISGLRAAGISVTTNSADSVDIDLSGTVRGATDGISVVNNGDGGFSIVVRDTVKADIDRSASGDEAAIRAFSGTGDGSILIGKSSTVAGPTGISVGSVAGSQIKIVNNGAILGGTNGGTTLAVSRGSVRLANNGRLAGNVSSSKRTQSFSIINNVSGVWDYTGGLVSQLAGKSDLIVNNGTFDSSKGAASFVGLEGFQNNKTMNIATFAMDGAGDLVNAGVLTVRNRAALSFTGGSDLVNAKAGTMSLSNATLTGNIINSGTVNFANNGTLRITGGSLFNREDGLIDAQSAAVAGNVTNDGTIRFGGRAVNSQFVLNGALTNTGTIDFGNSAAADRFIVNGNVLNSGRINLSDGATGDRLTVNGNAIASQGSVLALDVDVVTEGNSSTDSVRVNGATSGETNLVLNLVDRNGNDVELRDANGNLVDAIDTSARQDIRFSNGQLYDRPVVLIDGNAGGFDVLGADPGTTLAHSGFINYVLGSGGGGDVTLNSELDRNQAGGVVASFSSTLSTIDTIFHKPSSALVSGCTGNEKNGIGYAAWARANGGDIDTETEGTATIGKDSQNVSTKNKTDFYGFQGGLDTVFCSINPNGASLHVGLTGGYIQGNSDQEDGGFSTDFNSYFLGAYTAFISGSFSADASIRYAIHNMDLSHEDTSIIEDGTETDGDTIAGSMSATYRFMLSDTVRLAPSAGLTIARTSIDSFEASGGKVSFDDETSIIGYAGIGLSKAFQISDSTLLIPLVQASVYHEFEDNDDAAFELGNVRAKIETDKISTYGQFTAGLQTHIAGDPNSNQPTFTGGIRFDAQVGEQIDGWALGAEGRIQF